MSHRMFIPNGSITGGAYKTMTRLIDFINLKLKITWTLIDIGYRGSDVFQYQLTTREILDYASSLLVNDDVSDDVVQLAVATEKDEEVIAKYVRRLSLQENVDRSVELKKWCVCYLKKRLIYDECNYINGLVTLTDLWINIHEIADFHYTFQGVENYISPKEYYTRENYECLYLKSCEWLEKTLKQLQV